MYMVQYMCTCNKHPFTHTHGTCEWASRERRLWWKAIHSSLYAFSACLRCRTSRWTSAVVCCSVLQCVAVCYSVLQCVAVCCSVSDTLAFSFCRRSHTSFSVRVRHTAAAAHCNTLQHTAIHRNTLPLLPRLSLRVYTTRNAATNRNALQHTATHCNALQRTNVTAAPLTPCSWVCNWSEGIISRWVQHTGNPLQHTATHCNTLMLLRHL